MAWYGSITMIRERHLYGDETYQAIAMKRGITILVITSILLIAIIISGWYYLGITFLMYFAIVFILNYFGEKRHIRRRARQREQQQQAD